MTPQQILIVVVRLFAISWFVVSIEHLVRTLRMISQYNLGGLDRLTVALPVLQLIICAGLWFFPATLSRRLLKGGNGPGSVEVPALAEWQSVAIVVLGLWTLSKGIPDAVYYITYFLTYDESVMSARDLMQEQWPYMAATLVEITIGIWLIFGARGLVAMLASVRNAGLRS